MFCCQCGSRSPESANFCSNCGHSLKSSAEVVSSRPSTSSGQETVRFDEFRARKERERTLRLAPKSKKAKIAPKAKETEVNINVGIMKLDNTGNFKRCRGKTLPIKVLPSADKTSISGKAVKKHANYDKTIHEGLEYVLLYPDGNEVVNLPGTDHKFSLKEYREDVGKTYNRITLFIATRSDFLFSVLPSLDDDDSDFHEDSGLGHSIYENVRTDSTGREKGAGSSSEVGVEAPKPGSSNNGENTPHVQGPMMDMEEGLQNIECPTCLQLFPVTEIADHADACCDICVGEVAFPDLDPLPCSFEMPQEQQRIDGDILLKDVISSLAESLSENPVRLNVRRKHMWSDFKEARIKQRLNPGDRLKIVYVGEPAVDDGGPRSEFFSEMLEHIERRLFLDGIPIDSTVSLSNGDFALAGEIIAMSILQGGPAPSFFDPNVFDYISNQPLSPESIEANKEAALKIKNARDDKELQQLLMTDEIFKVLEEIGYTGVSQRETTKTSRNIVQSICIKSQFPTTLPQLMQLQEGLKSNGLLESIRQFPMLWKAVFLPNESSFSLSADDFLDQLVPTFSCSQAEKQLEIDVFKLFSDFVQFMHEQGDLAINDLVKWMTGTKTVPVLGFSKKFSITFVHGCDASCRCRPTTSTCDLLLKMPVHISSFDDMVEMMSSALKDCIGFGLI